MTDLLPEPPDHEATPDGAATPSHARALAAWGSGWPNCQGGRQVKVTGGGVSVHVRAEVAPLVKWALDETRRTGYVLKQDQTGAYVCRPIGGTSTPSNHSWGLAIDLNWRENPFTYDANAPRTITPEVVRLWKLVGFAWGGDWSGKKDFMHVEFNGSPAEAARRVAALDVPHGEIVADFSYAKPTAEQVVAAGLTGVIGYVSNAPAKNIGKPLIDSLLAKGKTVNLVWQEGAHGPLGGAAQGATDAKEANRQADALGAPDWLPIVYAVDFDATAVQLAVVADYFRAVLAVSKRPVGAYGGLRTIDYLAPAVPGLALFWQAKAWSAGKVSIHSHLLQEAGAPYRPIPGVATDDNTVLKAFVRWGHTPQLVLGPITVHPYPEEQMRRFDLTMPLDDQGCGWRDVPTDRDPENVVSIVVNAADPPGNGYRSTTASRLNVDGKTRVVVTGGPPRGEVGLDVWVAD